MIRKAKRWCVWVRWMDDGPRRNWSDFQLVATFEWLTSHWTGYRLAHEYRNTCWTARRQVRVFPEGKRPGGKP